MVVSSAAPSIFTAGLDLAEGLNLGASGPDHARVAMSLAADPASFSQDIIQHCDNTAEWKSESSGSKGAGPNLAEGSLPGIDELLKTQRSSSSSSPSPSDE